MNGKKNKERSLQMDKVKRYTSIDRPVAKYSEAGEHIYEWEYIDKEGKIKKDKKIYMRKYNHFILV
jgi:hypothetical protein